MLDESAVEGADGVKADLLADLADRRVALGEQSAGVRDADGIDIIVKAHTELLVHYVRDVIFAYILGLFL